MTMVAGAVNEQSRFYSDRVIGAYLGAGFFTPQSLTAQPMAMGSAALGDILSGAYSWETFEHAIPDSEQLARLGRAMVQAHRRAGIDIGPRDLDGDTSSFFGDYRALMDGARVNAAAGIAVLGAALVPEKLEHILAEPTPSTQWQAQRRISSAVKLLLTPEADGEFPAEVGIIKQFFDRAASTFSPKNPRAIELRDTVHHNFSVLEGFWVRYGLRPFKRREAQSQVTKAMEGLKGLVLDNLLELNAELSDQGIPRESIQDFVDLMQADEVQFGNPLLRWYGRYLRSLKLGNPVGERRY